MKLHTPSIALILAMGLGPLQTGCPAFLSALPAVTSAVVEIGNIVDTIATWVDAWFRARPDATTERRVQLAIAKTRNAMNAVLRLSEAKKNADDGEIASAFDNLEAAYRELLELTKPMGVRPDRGSTGTMAPLAAGQAGPDPVLEVPAQLRRPR